MSLLLGSGGVTRCAGGNAISGTTAPEKRVARLPSKNRSLRWRNSRRQKTRKAARRRNSSRRSTLCQVCCVRRFTPSTPTSVQPKLRSVCFWLVGNGASRIPAWVRLYCLPCLNLMYPPRFHKLEMLCKADVCNLIPLKTPKYNIHGYVHTADTLFCSMMIVHGSH